MTNVTERPPAVRARPAHLPRFWDRSAVFVANVLSLFYGNRRQTEILTEQIKGIESYGGRLLPLIDLLFTGGGNLLVLESEPAGELRGYHEGLGLSLPEVLLTTGPARTGRRRPGMAPPRSIRRHRRDSYLNEVRRVAAGESDRSSGRLRTLTWTNADSLTWQYDGACGLPTRLRGGCSAIRVHVPELPRRTGRETPTRAYTESPRPRHRAAWDSS